MNAVTTRTAPRVPAGPNSLASQASKSPAISPTRRAMLGVLAAPALLAAPFGPAASNAAPAADRTAWNQALGRYKAANAAWISHPYKSALPGSADYARLDKEDGELMRIAINAIDALMATPTPDHRAALEKLEIYILEFGDNSSGEYLNAIAADVRRLSRDA